MIRKLKRLWRKTYFIPMASGVGALALAAGTACMDQRGLWPAGTSAFLFTTPELGRIILSVLVGALLTMTTITFSTIMVVLTLYSGQFSPRVLQDFLENRITLRILGAFMGTFVYAVVSLLLAREGSSPGIAAPGIGVVLAVFCLALFAYFLHHVAKSIQINSLIERLTREILGVIEEKVEEIRAYENIRNRPAGYAGLQLGAPDREICSGKAGYIQGFDEKTLVALGREHGFVVKTEQKVGDYVDEETPVLTLYESNPGVAAEEALEHRLAETFFVGEDRNREQDVDLGISKLVEIALRAISPGINDPNTAIFCIGKIGQILKKTGRELEKVYYYDEEGRLRLIVENLEFGSLLYQSYYQLKNYAMKDVAVVAAMIDSLAEAAEPDNHFVKREIRAFSGYVLSGVSRSALQPLDRLYLDGKIEKLEQAVAAPVGFRFMGEVEEEREPMQ